MIGSYVDLKKQGWKLGIISVGLILVVITSSSLLPTGVDWQLSLRPATLKLLNGSSPYVAATDPEVYAGAPWGLIPLIPLAIFPESVGRALLLIISIVAFAFAAVRLGGNTITVPVFLLSPPVVHCLLNANLDWMPVVGFVLPPWLGLFLIAVKPQMGSVLAVFWLVETWRKGGILQAIKVFAPITVTILISFIIFGLWPLNSVRVLNYSQGWNASLWPVSLPVGLALTVAAIRLRQSRYAMAASPCLSPYVLFHAWSGALVTLVASTAELIAAVVGLWILVFFVALTG